MTGATLAALGFDGRAALTRLLEASEYQSVGQAVASLTLFAHPETVRQTGGAALFPVVRSVGSADRHTYLERNGRKLRLDDNAAPTAVFDWCHGLKRAKARDLQLNHIYSRRDDPESFTALPNLCRTPAFMAKLTDNDAQTHALLKRRSFELYGWRPAGEPIPAEPPDYGALEWADPLDPVDNVERVLRGLMLRRLRSFCAVTARDIGWHYSNGAPDPAFALRIEP